MHVLHCVSLLTEYCNPKCGAGARPTQGQLIELEPQSQRQHGSPLVASDGLVHTAGVAHKALLLRHCCTTQLVAGQSKKRHSLEELDSLLGRVTKNCHILQS